MTTPSVNSSPQHATYDISTLPKEKQEEQEQAAFEAAQKDDSMLFGSASIKINSEVISQINAPTENNFSISFEYQSNGSEPSRKLTCNIGKDTPLAKQINDIQLMCKLEPDRSTLIKVLIAKYVCTMMSSVKTTEVAKAGIPLIKATFAGEKWSVFSGQEEQTEHEISQNETERSVEKGTLPKITLKSKLSELGDETSIGKLFDSYFAFLNRNVETVSLSRRRFNPIDSENQSVTYGHGDPISSTLSIQEELRNNYRDIKSERKKILPYEQR